jgi:hypothetical protein
MVSVEIPSRTTGMKSGTYPTIPLTRASRIAVRIITVWRLKFIKEPTRKQGPTKGMLLSGGRRPLRGFAKSCLPSKGRSKWCSREGSNLIHTMLDLSCPHHKSGVEVDANYRSLSKLGVTYLYDAGRAGSERVIGIKSPFSLHVNGFCQVGEADSLFAHVRGEIKNIHGISPTDALL